MVSEDRDLRERTDERGEDTDGEEVASTAPLRRRGFMKYGAAAAATAGLPAVMGSAGASEDVELMEDPSPENMTVGGGNHYQRTVRREESDHVVENRGELVDALEDARRGDVVYVPNDAKIDLTGESDLYTYDGVTVASGRGLGKNGAPGGLVYTDDYDTLFRVYADDVRFTGLRIRGPRLEYFDPSDLEQHLAKGVWLMGKDGEIDNCELFGWSHAAVSVGSRKRTNGIHVHHNSIHNNAMEGLGYGVNLYNGHSLIEWNYFGMNRHAISGFGYETCGYEARNNLVGPRSVSHAFDMHGLNQNIGGADNVAGGTISIHHNTFRFTQDVLGRPQEAIAIRGIPDDRAQVEKNHFEHDQQPDDGNVGAHGQAYRQPNTGSDDWRNFHVAANHFGPHRSCADVGMPKAKDTLNARAVAPDGRKRSGLRMPYKNGFDQRMRITDVTITPESSKVVRLADGSWDEGRWDSEVHVEADVRNGTTDVNGGIRLPGSVDLDSDGHSSSPNVEPVLSAGSTATCFFRDFLDRKRNRLDMRGERVAFRLDFQLDDGTACYDEFDVVPK